MTEQEQWNEADDPTAIPDEWREIEAEDKIVLEMKGEGFIGRFMGMDPPNANGIVQGHWTNVTDLHYADISQAAFMNVTRDLINKLKKVPVKSVTRIEWVDNLDTGHESGTKMRVFKVQWK